MSQGIGHTLALHSVFLHTASSVFPFPIQGVGEEGGGDKGGDKGGEFGTPP